MKKLFNIILILAAFALGADVKPFIFDSISTEASAQQAEWDYLLKYKVFGAAGIEFNNQLIRLPDKSGWFGTSHGDFIVEQNGQDTVGGNILIGGNMFIKQGPLVLSTGPVRITNGITIDQKDNFKGKQNYFAGAQCITGNVPEVYANFIPDSNKFFNTTCPNNVPEIKTNLYIPSLSTKDTTYSSAIYVNEQKYDTIKVPKGEGVYDVYIESINATNTGKLFVQMPKNGRLTRVFLRDGINLGSAHPRIQILYDNEDGTYTTVTNKDYAGNLLFYTNNDISFESFHNTDTIQGTFISTGTIKIAHHLTLAGQLLANKIIIDTDLDGSGFIFKPFDPPVIDLKPELDKEGGLKENNITVSIPIALDTPAVVDVFFTYCFDFINADTSDFNIEGLDFPLCNNNEHIEIKIHEGEKEPREPILVNVRIDTLTEFTDFIVLHIDSISGAVLPGNKTSGELTIRIIDTNIKHEIHFDTTAVYSVNENYTGYVDSIRIKGKTDSTRFILDSAVYGKYTLDPITGILTLNTKLDYEKNQVDTIKVTINDGTGYTETKYIPIKINDVNEAPILHDTTLSLTENSPIPSIVGTLKVLDEDKNKSFTQNVFEPLESSIFAIDQNGRITATKIFNYEKDDTVYTIKVRVHDKNDITLKDSAIVTIKISDFNESPKFNSNDTTIVIKENTPAGIIGKVEAYDDDGDTLKYSIINNVPFKIDNDGNISSTREFDYEKEKQFTFKVIATDGKLSDTITVKVLIDNVNEPLTVNDTTFTIDEGITGIIGKVIAKDEDGDGDDIRYSVDDSVRYSIDNNGNIKVNVPFDFDSTKVDTLLVYATDGEFTDTAKVIININNVNETPKLLPNDSLQVPENCPKCTVGIITAIDPDGDSLTYSVIEQGFIINDSTGLLTIVEPIDFEVTPFINVTIIAKDSSGAADTMTYTINIINVNEPVHVKDTTCAVKENYTGNVCQISAIDEDKIKPIYILPDTTNYRIDTNGVLIIKNPIDFEKKQKDTVTVIVTDGENYDTATVIIDVLDEVEKVDIIKWDDKTPVDTVKTNDPNHSFEWQICENTICKWYEEFPNIHKDTIIKVCNDNNTVCDSIVVLFNDAPPIVTLQNTKTTNNEIDYITIEEVSDDKIYVNKKNNELLVIVKDTVNHIKKEFPINVSLDTIHVSTSKIKEYNYVIDMTKAIANSIGNGIYELTETIQDGNNILTISKLYNDNLEPIDSVQIVKYTIVENGKEVTVTYTTDDLTGQRISNYEISYNIDSCTTVSYELDNKKKIVKNSEGNIFYTVSYEYTDDFGNKSSSKVNIVFDNILPKVEILNPIKGETFKRNAINVEWTVDGIIQDTLTMQRLEKGANLIIRKYVDKAGNIAIDTVLVIMSEAKDIDINIVYPVTKLNQDKIDSFYNAGNKYNDKKPYTVTTLKNDEKPDPIGIGFKVDIALPSVSPTGGLASLDDIVVNGMIPVDDKGNIVGASTRGIPVEEYVEQHCTDEFKQDYRKNGLNIPLYDVTYHMHLWIYTTTASYVNDFNVQYTLNDEDEATSAGTVTMVIDYLADRDGFVKAENHKALGTGSYITKLFSKSIAKHRCDYKEQVKGDKTIKKEDTFTVFGYKRPVINNNKK